MIKIWYFLPMSSRVNLQKSNPRVSALKLAFDIYEYKLFDRVARKKYEIALGLWFHKL